MVSVDPEYGGTYQYAPEETLPDAISEQVPTPQAVTRQYVEGPSGRRVRRPVADPRLGIEAPVNPDGSDFGPMYIDPKYDQWLIDNVIEPDYGIDWVSRTLINDDGQVVGNLPEKAPPIE